MLRKRTIFPNFNVPFNFLDIKYIIGCPTQHLPNKINVVTFPWVKISGFLQQHFILTRSQKNLVIRLYQRTMETKEGKLLARGIRHEYLPHHVRNQKTATSFYLRTGYLTIGPLTWRVLFRGNTKRRRVLVRMDGIQWQFSAYLNYLETNQIKNKTQPLTIGSPLCYSIKATGD